jgi:hypothetical protein
VEFDGSSDALDSIPELVLCVGGVVVKAVGTGCVVSHPLKYSRVEGKGLHLDQRPRGRLTTLDSQAQIVSTVRVDPSPLACSSRIAVDCSRGDIRQDTPRSTARFVPDGPYCGYVLARDHTRS